MSIIMFHYVKPYSQYYHFNLDRFEDFVKTNQKKIVSLKKYIEDPQKDAIVLSFDDGTLDHYTNVFPILKKYNVTGVFSVCENIFTKKILDIQKIHKLLERVGSKCLFEEFTKVYKDYSSQYLLQKYGNEERVIKNLLQSDLPSDQRESILNYLVDIYKINLSFDDLYINEEMIKEMADVGNEFVYHTKTHPHLNKLSYEDQLKEIKDIEVYKNKFGFLNMLTLPFGDYNEDTLQILEKFGIDIVIGVRYTDGDQLLTRIDCSVLK